MTEYVTKCPHCGARAKEIGPFCAFCGSRLPQIETPIAAPVLAVVESKASKFRRLEAHPQFAELLARQPSAAGPIAAGMFGTVAMIGFVILAIVMVSLFRNAGALILFPIVIGAIGLLALIRQFGKTAQLATAETVAKPILIADERSEERGSGDDSRSTHYFVTLEDREGLRTEYEASGNLSGRVTQGDIGVAYIKADRLIEFARVPLDS